MEENWCEDRELKEFYRNIAHLDNHAELELSSILSKLKVIKNEPLGGVLEGKFYEESFKELDFLANRFSILYEDAEGFRKSAGNSDIKILENCIEDYQSFSYSRAELVGILENELSVNEDLTKRQFDSIDHTPSTDTYLRKFGSWNWALNIAGGEMSQVRFAEEDLAHLVRTKLYEEGDTPTANEVKSNDRMPDKDGIRKMFGSWENFIREAGLESEYRVRENFERNRYELGDYMKDESSVFWYPDMWVSEDDDIESYSPSLAEKII